MNRLAISTNGAHDDNPMTLDVSPVPPSVGPELFILRLKGEENLTFAILAREIYGVNVHFGAGSKRSSPHFRDKERCPGCIAKIAMRWKGYLHCFCIQKSQEVFLELTPKSAHSLLGQIPGGNLRGNRIQVKRTKGDNGRLLISTLTAIDKPEVLPREKSPEESLLRLWGYDEMAAGKKPANGTLPPASDFQ